jgi:outer membrane biosynthesis protein TonB
VQEAVSAVLHDRARLEQGLSRTLTLSIAAHVVVVAAVWLTPAEWRSRTVEERPTMTISLGGTEGPNTGGMTTMAGRAVQEVAKPNAPKATDTPPAAKPPEMVEPDRIVKPVPNRPRPAPRSRRAPRA